MIQAVIISVGLFDPEAILSDITVVGIIVTEEVLITKNVIILREAISLLLFNSFSLVIAFIPKGVAALPSPSIFITIFDDIYAIAGSPLGISGNTTLIILDNLLDIIFSSPEESAIFIVPSHKHIRGTKLIIISIPLVPDVIKLLVRLESFFMILIITPSTMNIPHI